MFRSILVPLDGSPVAEHALPWALSIAQQDGAALHVARVHLPPTPIMVGSELASDVVLDDTIRKADREYLEGITERLGLSSTILVRYSLLEGGVTDAILDHAKAISADLVVMTTHGRGAFARFWLGSIADKVVRQSRIPTLLVRPRDETAADLTTRPFIHRIVVPLDGSELAEEVIEPVTKLGKATSAEYILVLVLEAVEDAESLQRMKIVKEAEATFPEATQAKAEVYLEKVADRMRSQTLKVQTKVIRHGSAAGAVLDYALSLGNPVIALATHGRSGIKRMLLGSVADKIVRGATMPVLVYHPVDA
jgi:nucleotide-binding universal stress UspA family protein